MKLRNILLSTLPALCVLFMGFSAHALTVSPVKLELRGAPGQTIVGEIELKNEQTDARTFYSSFENFEPSGDSGSPHFIGGGTGLATWITTEESVALQPDERKIVPFTITIPQDAEAGGYFSGIFFGGKNAGGQNGGEVAIGGKLGVLVLLRVEGDIDERGGLLSFMISGAERFVTQLPVSFAFKLNNQGADRIVPLGDIVVTNTFGMRSTVLSANKSEGSVLPGSARTYTTTWESEGSLSDDASFFDIAAYQFKNLHIGWYTAKLSVLWGMDNNESKARYDFIFFPWQAISIICVGLILVFFGLKRYNKWIVHRSQK